MDIILIVVSAAEISTGICCVCLPTLAALAHRGRRRPSTSILKNAHRSAHSQRHALTLDKSIGNNDDYIELKENGSHSNGITIPPNAVVTKISGGAEPFTMQSEGSMIKDLALRASEEQSDGKNLRLNIMKTVGIEQSYI